MREITSSILLVRSAALWWDRFVRSTCLIWVLISQQRVERTGSVLENHSYLTPAEPVQMVSAIPQHLITLGGD